MLAVKYQLIILVAIFVTLTVSVTISLTLSIKRSITNTGLIKIKQHSQKNHEAKQA